LNAILLAAGYGTRLYPLTRDRPKSLLPVGGRPILDYLADRLEAAPEIERMVLVSNGRFVRQFEEWAAARSLAKPLKVLNDGTMSNEGRLGAVGDVRFAMEEGGIGGQAAYVLATDNLPRFDLRDIIALSAARRSSAVFVCRSTDPQELKRMGIAQLDAAGRVVAFEEKPAHPKGELRVPPFYVYTAAVVGSVPAYLSAGGNPDAPGHFLEWVVPRQPVHACRRDEGTYDIGTLETYRAVCAEFAGASGGPSPGAALHGELL
jgi:glucose-1-phosphate thymidylyltransferase